MGLIRDLGAGPVALDTPVLIYFIEQHPKFYPVVQPLFEAIDAGKLKAVTSELTLLEVLVAPYRFSNDATARRYERILTRAAHLSLLPVSRNVLRAAARLRGATGLETPDAIQLATGLEAGATSFVTDDRSLPEIRGLRILQLAGYARPATDVREGRRRVSKTKAATRQRG